MRILYLGKNLENTYAASWYYMLKQLSRTQDLVTHGPTQSLRSRWIPNLDYGFYTPLIKIYSSIDGLRKRQGARALETDVCKIVEAVGPEVIVVGSFFPQTPAWRNLNKISTPKALMISDPHDKLENKLRYASSNAFDLCLFDHRFVMNLPRVRRWRVHNDNIACEWLPHSVDTRIFRNYNLPSEFDVVSAGSRMKSVYPLRHQITSTLASTTDIRFAAPPHARFELMKGVTPSKALIRENFAMFLTRSKIFAFGPSIYKYAVMKYFEGMACNTMVMAPTPFDAKELHFVPGVNFVEINEQNFLERIRYYLVNEEERREIARNGLRTVKKHHTVEIREKQLIRYFKAIE